MDTFFYAFVVLLFAAVIFLLEGAYLWWTSTRGKQAKRIEQRLRSMSAGGHGDDTDLSILKQRMLSESPAFERLLMQVPRIHVLDRLLEQSGIGWSVGKLVTYSGVAFLIGWLGCAAFTPSWFTTSLFAVAAGSLPWLLVLRARTKRMKKMEEQMPEATDLMSRALRSGHAFPSTLQMVGTEMPEPIAGEFRIVFDEINYGVAMNDALLNLATRVPLTDMRYFVIAVMIQRESGGNLAEILGSISQIIRERLKLLGRVRVLSAEGKMSAWVLGLLPFAVGMVIKLMHPSFLEVLWTDPIGVNLIWGALGMMVIGVLWMRKIIQIHV